MLAQYIMCIYYFDIVALKKPVANISYNFCTKCFGGKSVASAQKEEVGSCLKVLNNDAWKACHPSEQDPLMTIYQIAVLKRIPSRYYLIEIIFYVSGYSTPRIVATRPLVNLYFR